MMVADEQYYVIKLLEYNTNDDGSCVCVPKSWIKLHRSENQALVLYPKEDLETTLKRIEDGEKYHKSWLLYRGIVIHVTDNFEEAKLWIAKLNNANEQASPATSQYTDHSMSTPETHSPQPSSVASSTETNYQSNAASLKHEDSTVTNKKRKRTLQPSDADIPEHKNKYKQLKLDIPNNNKITNCTNQVKGDCLRRELLSSHHYNLNLDAHSQKVTLTTVNEINSLHKKSVSQTKSINLSSSTEISTNLSGQSSSNPKHVPIKLNDDLFQNINRSGGVKNNFCFNGVTKQSSQSPQGPIKTSVSAVPDEILHKKHENLHTSVGKPVNIVNEFQRNCTDSTNTISSTQDMEYLIDKYYEIYDPTNTDQLLKASVCKLLEEIHGLETPGKNSVMKCIDSRPQPSNVVINSQSKTLSTHSNDSKIVTSSTESKRLNNQALQNNLTNKPFHKEITPDAINKLSDKLSASDYYVPLYGNKITDSNSGIMKDNHRATSYKNKAVPIISPKVRQDSEQLIEQRNQCQEIPEYEIIVEKSTQTNKITILDTSKKENRKEITTSPDSTFKSEQYFPNSDTSVYRLLTKAAQQSPNEQNRSLKSSYHLNRNIQKLQNMSNQLTQPSCAQYPTLPHNYWTPPQYHQNYFNNYITTEGAHNTHYPGVQKHKTGNYENVSNQMINNLPPTTSYKDRPSTQSIKNVSQHFPFPVDHSRCCNRLHEEQFMQVNKNCLHHSPGVLNTQYVSRSYPRTIHNLRDQNLPMDFRPDLTMQMYPNNLYKSLNYSNARNSILGFSTYGYQKQQETCINSPTKQFERSLANNHVNQTIRLPETIRENTEAQLYPPCSNLKDRQLPPITHDNTPEITVTKGRCNMDKQIHSLHVDKNMDQNTGMSQATPSQPIECSKESLHSRTRRESIEEPCSQCGYTGNQRQSSLNLGDSGPLSRAMANISLMNDAFEKININVTKLNSELNNTNNMIEKFTDSLKKVMDTFIEYNQKINENTALTSQTLTKSKQGNKHINSNNKTVDENISKEEYINESQDVSNKTVTSKTWFALPPEYDPADSRWTLKHLSLGRGKMELVPGSRVYINIMDLGRCLKKAKTCKKLARMLLQEIFSQNALRVCSLTGGKARSSKFSDRDKRPGLDANARNVLVKYAQDYGRRRGWFVSSKNSILKSIVSLLQRLRI